MHRNGSMKLCICLQLQRLCSASMSVCLWLADARCTAMGHASKRFCIRLLLQRLYFARPSVCLWLPAACVGAQPSSCPAPRCTAPHLTRRPRLFWWSICRKKREPSAQRPSDIIKSSSHLILLWTHCEAANHRSVLHFHQVQLS